MTCCLCPSQAANACIVLYAFLCVSLKSHRIYFSGSDLATQASVSSLIWFPPECARADWEDVRPAAWAFAPPPEITRRYHGVFWEQKRKAALCLVLSNSHNSLIESCIKVLCCRSWRTLTGACGKNATKMNKPPISRYGVKNWHCTVCIKEVFLRGVFSSVKHYNQSHRYLSWMKRPIRGEIC